MNQSDFSCIKQVTKTVNLTIPLKYASNEIAGVTEILDGWKRQFVPKLQGVVVNYRNIRLTPRPIFIHISRTAPQYSVTANFDVFCPTIGDIVKGKINRTSREHIGCLIEGTINATIHLPYNSYPEVSKFVRINHEILFEINRFEFYRHTIRLNGQITPKCIELMEELFPNIKDEVPENMTNGFNNSTVNCDKDDKNTNSDSSSSEDELSTLKTPVFIKQEINTESENDSHKPKSPRSSKVKNSKKRKRDSESSSLDYPVASKKRKKSKEPELVIKKEIQSMDESSEMLSIEDTNAVTKKKKKKRKEKSSLNNDFASDKLADYNSLLDLESTLSAFDPENPVDISRQIKREVESPSASTSGSEKKGKKRKREKSMSDESMGKEEKTHNLKGSKKSKDKKLNESEKDKKSKKSKKDKKLKKSKLVTSGDIIKKDKTKSKDRKKKKHSISVPVSIKPELN